MRAIDRIDRSPGTGTGIVDDATRSARDLAEAGAAVLLYTSELKEVQLVCDRAIVIFGGRVVAEIARVDADEPSLLRAAYNLKADGVIPELAMAETDDGQ